MCWFVYFRIVRGTDGFIRDHGYKLKGSSALSSVLCLYAAAKENVEGEVMHLLTEALISMSAKQQKYWIMMVLSCCFYNNCSC